MLFESQLIPTVLSIQYLTNPKIFPELKTKLKRNGTCIAAPEAYSNAEEKVREVFFTCC